MLSSTVDLTNRSRQAHVCDMQLTEDPQEGHSCEIISWAHCEVAVKVKVKFILAWYTLKKETQAQGFLCRDIITKYKYKLNKEYKNK